MANQIFSQAGLAGYAGGDGTVLSVPWNPTFHYRLTFAAAWIWAKGVMANIATQHIPPNTQEFNQEIRKSEWRHPDMGVDDRVRKRLQGHPRKLKPVKGTSTFNEPSTSSRKSTRLTRSRVKNESKLGLNNLIITDFFKPTEAKPDLKKMKIENTNHNIIDLTKPKRIIDLTKAEDLKPDLKKVTEKRIITETEAKPDLKKVNIENQPGNSIEDPMCLSSDTESQFSESKNEESNLDAINDEDSKTDEIKIEDSEIYVTKIKDSDDEESEFDLEFPTGHHSVEMELFLADCELPYEDEKTRSIIKEAGIISWTDLIPSVQMTESTLTSKGIDRQIASRLLDEAKARYYTD